MGGALLGAVATSNDLLPRALDVAGTFAFALTGGLVAVKQRLDLIGVVVLAFVTGLGGGFIRDLALGATPPVAVENELLMATTLAAAALTFVFGGHLHRIGGAIDGLDAIGLGFFVAAGAEKAFAYGVDPAGAALIGVITAVGGGVIRDLLANRVPVVLRRSGPVYATPAAIGAIALVLLHEAGAPMLWCAVVGGASATVLRLLALRFHWQAPMPRTSRSAEGPQPGVPSAQGPTGAGAPEEAP